MGGNNMLKFNLINLEISLFIEKGKEVKDEHIEYNKDISPYTLKEFVEVFKKNIFGKPTKIGIVWGTTRHKPRECKHPGYISDAMYIPELIQNFQKLNRNVEFKSFLDIDILSEPELLKEYNLILCGDGEVNGVVAKLLKFAGDALKIKYKDPTLPFFDNKTSRAEHNMYGVVYVLRNLWAEKNRNRFIIFVGGIGPIGTIASIKWLAENLLSSSLPNSPFVIVKGEEKEYQGFDGYKNHCEYCCKIIEKINGEEKVYWEGKISNVSAVLQVYP